MEEWKDIEGYEGFYQISSGGIVKSLERIMYFGRGSSRLKHESILKNKINEDGYFSVTLSKNGNQKFFLVHRLVALAFIPNPENKPEVNHKNGVKLDNIKNNLEWCTRSENSIHAYKTGLTLAAHGEHHCRSKISEKQAKKIKYEHKDLSRKEISCIYGITVSSIRSIRIGKSWKHI